MRKKFNRAGIGQKVFGKVLTRGLVSVEDRTFGKVEFEAAEVLPVVAASWGEGDFDRITFSSGRQMDFRAVEKAAFAAVVSPISTVCGCFRVDSISINPNVIANFDWETVNQKQAFGTGLFVHLPKPVEKRFQKLASP